MKKFAGFFRLILPIVISQFGFFVLSVSPTLVTAQSQLTNPQRPLGELGKMYLQTDPNPRITDNWYGNSLPKKTDEESSIEADYLNNKDSKLEEEKIECDGIDFAMQMDFELTKDPVLGYPPSERLEIVRNLIGNGSTARSIQGSHWTSLGPKNVGGRTRAILFDPHDPNFKAVWAGAADGGLWYTSDITLANPTWNHINQIADNLAITCIAYDPNINLSNLKHTLYVGTGESWWNPGTGNGVRGDGIWKSDDGGNTWSNFPVTILGVDNFYIQKIVVSPQIGANSTNGEGVVYAGTDNGLMRSDDGGATWIKVLGAGTLGAATDKVCDIEIANNGNIYATLSWNPVSGGIYKSTTGAIGSWVLLNGTHFPSSDFSRIELALSNTNPGLLYALVDNNPVQIPTVASIFRSSDDGVNWEQLATPVDDNSENFSGGQGYYDLIAAVDPNDPNTLLVGGRDIYKTTDANLGINCHWNRLTNWDYVIGGLLPVVHADQHGILFRPDQSLLQFLSDNILVSNDGGLFYTQNGIFTGNGDGARNNGYITSQFYTCAMSNNPTLPNAYLGGTQDNGSLILYNCIPPCTAAVARDGDGGYCFYDDVTPAIALVSRGFGQFYSSNSFGTNFFTTPVGYFAGFALFCPHDYFIDPSDYDSQAGILYLSSSYMNPNCDIPHICEIRGVKNPGNEEVYDDIAISNFTHGGNANIGNISHLRISPYDQNALFVGTQGGNIFRIAITQNVAPTAPTGAASEISIPSMIGVGSVSCIEVGATENDLLVTFSNYGTTVINVWETHNASAGLGIIWTPKEGNLPDMPIRWALYNPNNRNEVLLATEAGIWSTDDIGAGTVDWGYDITSGIPQVRVNMLRTRSRDNLVLAATYGRGLFSSTIFNHPIANFIANCSSNNTITFSDQSSPTPTTWLWDFGDGSTSTVQNPVHTYTTSGTYTVELTVSTPNVGSGSITHDITVGSTPVVVTLTAAAAYCSGPSPCNGSIISNVTSGTGPFTYLWSNGNTTASPTNFCGGADYTISVTDINGCGTTATVFVGPTNLTAAIALTANILCFGGNTAAIVNASGGTPPYTYLWSDNSTSNTVTGLSAGPVTVTVTDAHLCTAVSSLNILAPTQLAVSCTVTANVSCHGGSNGAVSSLVNNQGTGPYTYLWSNNSTATSISGLDSRAYTITVTDYNGCTATCSVTVTQPATAITLSASATSNYNGSPISCFAATDGEITASSTNGQLPLLYSIGNGAYQSGNIFQNLSAGTYIIAVKDAIGCSATTFVTLTEPSQLSLSTTVNNTCGISPCNGEISTVVNGGTVPYSYHWSNSSTTDYVNQLCPGLYEVTVTDVNGCSATSSNQISLAYNAACSAPGAINICDYNNYDGFFNGEIVNSTVYIHSDFYVWTDFSFRGCTVFIDPGISIVVYSPGHLHIEDAGLIHSILQACTDPWQGITFIGSGPTALSVEANSIIRDAIVAINSDDVINPFILDHCQFINNGICIKLSNLMSIMSMSDVTFDGSGNIAPNIGIVLENQVSLAQQIGSPTSGWNEFINLSKGISISGSEVIVQHCKFTDIVSHCFGCRTGDGSAIISSGNAGGNPISLTVGGSTTDQCIFTNCTNGICMYGNVNLDAAYNNFDNTNYIGATIGQPIPTYGIYGLNSRNVVRDIHNNNFKRHDFGVYLRNSNDGDLYITNNLFNQFYNIPVRQGDRAITVWETHPPLNPQIHEISGNIIRHYQRGISLINQYKSTSEDNHIFFDNFLPTEIWYGIRIEGGSDNQIRNNETSRTGPDPTWNFEQLLYGISVERSENNFISENNLVRLGTGIRIFNTNIVNTINCNQLTNNVDQVTNELSWIGDQGSSGNAADNFWTMASATQGNIYWIGPPPSGNPPIWYVQNAQGFDPTAACNHIVNSPCITPFSAASPIWSTSTNSCHFGCITPDCIQELLTRIIEEEQEFANLEDDQVYDARRYAYEMLRRDSTLMYQGTVLDSVLQQFYDQMQNGNLQVIQQVLELLSQDSVSSAVISNSNITPENLSESNIQLFNEIFIHDWNEIHEISPNDSTVLEFIAYQNPASGGNAVYGARVMLGLDIADYYSAPQGERIGATSKIESGKIIPNPNTGQMKYIYHLEESAHAIIQLFNSRGIMIREYTLSAFSNSVDMELNDQPCGLYIYRVIKNETSLSEGKIVLEK